MTGQYDQSPLIRGVHPRNFLVINGGDIVVDDRFVYLILIEE